MMTPLVTPRVLGDIARHQLKVHGDFARFDLWETPEYALARCRHRRPWRGRSCSWWRWEPK